MKVLVSGATGVLGRRLVPELGRRGHEILALSRRHEQDDLLGRLGARPVRVNLFDVPGLSRAAGSVDAVVHAATRIPTRIRPREADWQENDELRVAGTRALLEVARRAGAARFVFPSLAWAEPRPDRRVASALLGERLVREAEGVEGVVLRCGWLYAPDAAHTRAMGQALARRRHPIVGRGANRWRLLHADDAATALADAVETSGSGTWNVADDEPVEQARFLEAFAQRLDAPRPVRLPAWLVGLFAGRDAARFLARDVAAPTAAFRDATGWRPRFPSYREGLDDVVAAWRAQDRGAAAG